VALAPQSDTLSSGGATKAGLRPAAASHPGNARASRSLDAQARLEPTERPINWREQSENASPRACEIDRIGATHAGESRLSTVNCKASSARKGTRRAKMRDASKQSRMKAEQRRLAELASTAGTTSTSRAISRSTRGPSLKEVEQHTLRDALRPFQHIIEGARTRAEEEARRIIGLAIQRYAGAHTFETTTATVALQGDEIKGRIIGREGRNIRAFEAATGITVLIDDTPNAVVLSGFDPVRREIAREAMQRLILDGRIYPTASRGVPKSPSHGRNPSSKLSERSGLQSRFTPCIPRCLKLLGRTPFRRSSLPEILDHSMALTTPD